MDKKNLIIVILIIIIIAMISSTLLYCFNFNKENKTIIGNETYGSVEKLGPYGNNSSNIKIAYVVGHHPQESFIHEIFLQEFLNSSNLKYSYYIYKINVTKNVEDYETGRMNGQLLARNYVLPDALKMNYSLLVDVHANWGNWDENEFMYSPVNGSEGEALAIKTLENCTFSTYFYPPNPTSHSYLAEPLNKNGTPAFYFEEFKNNIPQEMHSHTNSLIQTVDNLKF